MQKVNIFSMLSLKQAVQSKFFFFFETAYTESSFNVSFFNHFFDFIAQESEIHCWPVSSPSFYTLPYFQCFSFDVFTLISFSFDWTINTSSTVVYSLFDSSAFSLVVFKSFSADSKFLFEGKLEISQWFIAIRFMTCFEQSWLAALHQL